MAQAPNVQITGERYSVEPGKVYNAEFRWSTAAPRVRIFQESSRESFPGLPPGL